MGPRRIVGVVADVDDENVVPGPAFTVYQPFGQEPTFSGRLFVHARGNPYALVTPIERIIRESVGRSARGKGGDARRYPRGGSYARSVEHGGIRRLRGGGAGNRDRRGGRRAGLLGERADARVRHSTGGGRRAEATGGERSASGRRHRSDRGGGRGCCRISAGAGGGSVLRGDPNAGSDPHDRVSGSASRQRRWWRRCCRRRGPRGWM